MRARGVDTWRDTWADVRRAFSDFLLVPIVTVAAFLLLAFGMYALDHTTIGWLEPTRAFLRAYLVTDPQTTETLLGTIAGGIITVTSITFSLLLLAVQQSAAALTAQVLDQFLHRRLNQLYFGAFVGISLYALLTLAASNTQVTPVFGAVMALALTLVALSMLVLLLYTTLNQMRPNRIVGAIHDLTLAARERQQPLLCRTRRSSAYASGGGVTVPVPAESNGYVAGLDLDRIGRATTAASGEVEVVLTVSLGTYVCFHDVVAEVRALSAEGAQPVVEAVRGALSLERQRNLRIDAGYGVSQLATIGWTSISTAKSNPAPGLAAMRDLRDLLARWSADPAPHETGRAVPVVYRDDVLEEALDALESLAVVSSESMQHQSYAAVLHAFVMLFDRLPPSVQPRAEQSILRILSALGDHVLTTDLDAALDRLGTTLASAGRTDTANAVRRARAELAMSVGTLNSRATRVPRHG